MDHDTCGSKDNPEADRRGSYLHLLMCQLPLTWKLPLPSLVACQGWHPSIASLHLLGSLGNILVSLVLDSGISTRKHCPKKGLIIKNSTLLYKILSKKTQYSKGAMIGVQVDELPDEPQLKSLLRS